MDEDSYDYECMRAELLGLPRPDEAEFERIKSLRLEQQLAEQEAAEAALLEQQDESLRGAGGKLDELNSILSSTQQKLNRFKQTACGSLTNIFSRGSVDITDAAAAAAASTTSAACSTETAAAEQADLESEQEQSGEGEVQPIISTEKIRAAKLESQKKMDSQLDKLDALINKADHTQITMDEQNKQMRRMAK